MIRQLLTIYSIATTDKEVQDRLRDRWGTESLLFFTANIAH